MLEEKLEKLKGIWCSIEFCENKYAVAVSFPEGYSVFTDVLDRIKVINDTQNSGKYWYIGKNDTIGIIDIIDFIEETVKINEEAIKKAKLYEEKVKELQECFNNENFTYKDLENISFGIKKETITQSKCEIVTKPMPKKPTVGKNNKKPKDGSVEKAVTEGDKQVIKDNSTQMTETTSTGPKTANFNDFQKEAKKEEKESIKERKIINSVDVTELIGG